MLDWTLTLIWLATSVGVFFLASWQSGRPPRDDLTPRMIPWRLIMIIAVFSGVLCCAHLINLFGYETGPEHDPRRRSF